MVSVEPLDRWVITMLGVLDIIMPERTMVYGRYTNEISDIIALSGRDSKVGDDRIASRSSLCSASATVSTCQHISHIARIFNC